jgi:hypothetical protein
VICCSPEIPDHVLDAGLMPDIGAAAGTPSAPSGWLCPGLAELRQRELAELLVEGLPVQRLAGVGVSVTV